MTSLSFILSAITIIIALFYSLKNRSWLFLLISFCTLCGAVCLLLNPVLLFSHGLALIIIGIGTYLFLACTASESNRLKWTRVTFLLLAMSPFLFKWAQWPGAELLLFSFIPCTLCFIFLFFERRRLDEQPFYELGICLLILGFWTLP